MRVGVVGATGKTGRYLVTRLCGDGHAVVALSRSLDRLASVDACAKRRQADVVVPSSIGQALADCEVVVSLAHARLTAPLLAALPERCRWVVLTGSVRRSTALPDAAADAVRRGEAAFREWIAAGGRGVMLHPSMIYGAPDDRNVGRLLRFIRGWPRALPLLVPLPGGGRHTVQPVYFEDFVAALAKAVRQPNGLPLDLEIVGPEAMQYRDLVRASAAALGRGVTIVPVPLWLLGAAARIAGALGVRVPFTAAELRRGTEDKRFAVEPMRTLLGVTPRSFDAGVREKVARGWF
ncbi:MAG: NADH-ubiquinone oxidoreductase [Alphaproteobacteria bacterium]|nr:NADH-ubiquinone oxidoreductase [Alphaproteobacteria bacterium]